MAGLEPDPDLEPPSLSQGGLLYRLERKLGLPDSEGSGVKRRIAVFVGLAWVPLAVLSAVEGLLVGTRASPTFLHDPSPHARFLLALPLLIVAEGVIDGMLGAVHGAVLRTGLIPPAERSGYRTAIDELERRRDRLWMDPALLLLAFGVTWWLASWRAGAHAEDPHTTWVATVGADGRQLTLAGIWYTFVSIPMFQFLGFRWTWRFLVWVGFLFRMSRLKLALEPTHPDRAGGLAVVAMAQKPFVLLFAAGSVVLAGVLGQEILYQGGSLPGAKGVIVGFVVGSLVVLELPLFLFFGQLAAAKRRGLIRHGAMGSRLSGAFRKTWIEGPEADADALLQSADPSAVADYAADYETVAKMRPIPVSPRDVIPLAFVLLLPFLPLALMQRDVTDVLKRLAGMFF